MALKEAQRLRARSLTVYSDSQLIVNQVNGDYKVRDTKLRSLLRETLSLMRGFQGVEVKAVGREMNKLADSLANRAIDTRGEEKYPLDG